MSREAKLDVLVSFAILLILAGVLFAQTIEKTVTLLWDYSPLSNMTFNVYHSADPNAPLDRWQKLTNVVATNRLSLTVLPGEHYFIVTASNRLGESIPATR